MIRSQNSWVVILTCTGLFVDVVISIPKNCPHYLLHITGKQILTMSDFAIRRVYRHFILTVRLGTRITRSMTLSVSKIQSVILII